jgi:hypothetical protein
MRHCVTKMLDRHSIVFNGMMNRLKVDRHVNLKIGFNQVSDFLKCPFWQTTTYIRPIFFLFELCTICVQFEKTPMQL